MKIAYRHKGLSEKPQETRPFIMTVNYQDTSVPQEIGYVAGTLEYVDWGDGTINTETEHTYASTGEYDIKIMGEGLHLKVGSIATDIKQRGDVVWGSMIQMFVRSPIETRTATDTPDLSNVTSMRYMFREAKSFNQPLNDWDTSNVTSMSHMFDVAKSFNQNLNNWDTSSVTDMNHMFREAKSFNQPLNNWDTSNVTYMNHMFRAAKSFNQPLNNWDTSNVTSVRSMFSGATTFNQPLNNWDTSNVTYMEGMFREATTFDQDISNRCVTNIPSRPASFDDASGFEGQTAKQPQWGTCP